jgi:hypothetical protein
MRMSLKEILTKLTEEKLPVLLCDSQREWEAESLLGSLSEPRLRASAYLQPGLYIAEISESGYLGRLLYKIKEKRP